MYLWWVLRIFAYIHTLGPPVMWQNAVSVVRVGRVPRQNFTGGYWADPNPVCRSSFGVLASFVFWISALCIRGTKEEPGRK